MIKLQNVYKTYFLGDEQVHAVDNVSLEIKEKEYVSILGSSGSGKSTLMYLIGLLEHPSSGEIYLNDKSVSSLGDERLSQIRNEAVGFVFQSFNLIPKFTVLENILLPTKYAKRKLEFNPVSRAEELLKKFGIWERRNFFPNKISGGQQQRVAIARALIMKPKIILADEPTGNLDTKTGESVFDLLQELNRIKGVTLIVVTHNLTLAEKMSRQIQLIDGKTSG